MAKTIKHKTYFNLTSGQRWLLYVSEQSPDTAGPVQRVYRFNKDFNPAAFFEAVQYVVKCHPALSLRIAKNEDGWKQYFAVQEVKIKGEEVIGGTQQARSIYTGNIILDEAGRTLDLKKESPFVIKLIKVDGEYLASICLDHIAADEMAFDLVEKSLLTSYEQITRGITPTEFPVDDVIKYVQKETSDKIKEELNLSYWKQHLNDIPIGDTNHQSFWGAAVILDYIIEKDDLVRLSSFCKENKCSFFNVMIALELLLIVEITGMRDIVLNIPISNRVTPWERNIIANLSMLMHVRFQVFEGEPLGVFVRRIRDQILTAMVHRQYDYPALAAFVGEKTGNLGFNAGWILGANFVIDSQPIKFPNCLFEERLDNQPGRVCHVPPKSIIISSRQSADALSVSVECHARSCKISRRKLKSTFQDILNRFLA